MIQDQHDDVLDNNDEMDDIDDSGFDEIEEDFDGFGNAQSGKRKPLLVMGGGLLVILLIGGYLLKGIFMGESAAPVLPVTAAAPPVTTPTVAAPIMAPVGISAQQTAMNGSPPPAENFNAYDSRTAGSVIGDEEFNNDMAGVEAPDPFATFDVPPDTDDLKAEEESAVVIPFGEQKENPPETTPETGFAIEEVPVADLTDAASQGEVGIPSEIIPDFTASEFETGPTETAAPIEPVEQVGFPPVETPSETVAATADMAQINENQADIIDGLYTQIEALKAENAQLRARLDENQPVKVQTVIETEVTADSGIGNKAETEMEAETTEKPEEASDVSSATPPKPAIRPTEIETRKKPAARDWVLRAANGTEAYISLRGSDELRPVQVGDFVPGLGRIGAITRPGNAGWQVIATNGSISQ